MVECELNVLCGLACTFVVQLEWTIATLKERIDDELGYPCYSLVLSDSDRVLRNAEKLRDVYRRQGENGSRFLLFVAFIDVPSQLEPTQVRLAWDAFRIYSTDYGDTVPWADFGRVMRYLCTGTPHSQVENLGANEEHICFADVLSFLTTSDDTSASERPDELVARICCFSEIAGASRSKKHSEASKCTKQIQDAINMCKRRCSQAGSQRRRTLFDSSQRARSNSALSKGPLEDESSTSSRLHQSSASATRRVPLASISL
eukprot:TRINITY_DN8756_c0_g2_i1.p1 TRINITY_DN8756_c0_g2~~TRINITY_DN8756_c0_g2_i1.p1  ORF type:complete len:260 (+),score=22.10 TRINITY_DN8756_c0_g2_i1:62-841(+)